jgi:glutaredoxin
LPAVRSRQVVLFTRAGCHLCDDVHALLAKMQKRHAFSIVTVDVDDDAAAAARYGDRVPVVVIDGKERFFGRVNPALLERLLNAGS